MAVTIAAAVGRGGANQKIDTRKVQRLLNAVFPAKLPQRQARGRQEGKRPRVSIESRIVAINGTFGISRWGRGRFAK